MSSGLKGSSPATAFRSHTGRRRVLMACAGMLLLGGCGFHPVYGSRGDGSGPRGSVARHLAAVEVGLIADRIGQMLRNELMTQLHYAGTDEVPLYQLEVQVTEQEEQLSVERDATSTRANLRVTALFTLVQINDSQILLRGSLNAVNSFAIQRTTEAVYSTIVAREDARRRGVRTVADKIVNRIALLFGQAIESQG